MQLTRIATTFAVLAMSAGVADAAQAQTRILPSGGSPEQCLATYIGQGISIDEAVERCAADLGGGSGGVPELGSGSATESLSTPATCTSAGGVNSAGDGGHPDAAGALVGDEIVVVGPRTPSKSRKLTAEERQILWDAADAKPEWHEGQPQGGVYDTTVVKWWQTAANRAALEANQNPTRENRAYRDRIKKHVVFVLAVYWGHLETVPGSYTKQTIKNMAAFVRFGPPVAPWGPRTKDGGTRPDPQSHQCEFVADMLNTLRECERIGWTSVDCRKLAGCQDDTITDPTPDEASACGEPDLDVEALVDAAVSACQRRVDPQPGQDPCAVAAGAFTLADSETRPGDRCTDPVARPEEGVCLEASNTDANEDRITQVLTIGLDRLGGPIIVLTGGGIPGNPPPDHAPISSPPDR